MRVTDAGGLTYDKTFTIGVSDMDEAPAAPVVVAGPAPVVNPIVSEQVVEVAAGPESVVPAGPTPVVESMEPEPEPVVSDPVVSEPVVNEPMVAGPTPVVEPVVRELVVEPVVSDPGVEPMPVEPELTVGSDPVIDPVGPEPVVVDAGLAPVVDLVVNDPVVAAGLAPVVEPVASDPVVAAGPTSVVDPVVSDPVVGVPSVHVGATTTSSPGLEQTLMASLHQQSLGGADPVRPLTSSPSIMSDTDQSGIGGMDELHKPVEWSSQPASAVDILSTGRNVQDSVHQGESNQIASSGMGGAFSTVHNQQDEIIVDLDSTNAARPEFGQVPWPPVEETEKVPEDSGDLAMPMVAGLVGAALQGGLRKKDKMTTMHGDSATGEQQTADEQTTQESNSDGKEVPPRAA